MPTPRRSGGDRCPLLEPAIERIPPGAPRAMVLYLLATMRIHNNSFEQAADLLEEALIDANDSHEILVQCLMLLSFAQLNTGEFDASLQHRTPSRDEGGRNQCSSLDQSGVGELGDGELHVRARHGVDDRSMARALELEDPNSDAPIAFRASANNAPMLAYTGG
jgi:hypothetical protein